MGGMGGEIGIRSNEKSDAKLKSWAPSTVGVLDFS